jgi:hypothetical protein
LEYQRQQKFNEIFEQIQAATFLSAWDTSQADRTVSPLLDQESASHQQVVARDR